MKVKELIEKLNELSDEQKELDILCEGGCVGFTNVEVYEDYINLF